MDHDEFVWIREELRWQAQLLYVLLQRQGIEVDLEKKELKETRKELAVVKEIRRELRPRLGFIKIHFGGTMPVGPVTLAPGQATTATVQGFDQNGAPFAIDFTNNAVTWTVDNAAVATSTPNADQSDAVVGVAAGVANLTAAVAGFSDTETVTVVAAAPVLSSVKISFA